MVGFLVSEDGGWINGEILRLQSRCLKPANVPISVVERRTRSSSISISGFPAGRERMVYEGILIYAIAFPVYHLAGGDRKYDNAFC